MKKELILLVLILTVGFRLSAQNAKIVQDAQRCFEIMKQVDAKDNGSFWGYSLLQNMLIVDPETRNCVSNQKLEGLKLDSASNLFMGKLIQKAPLANTSIRIDNKIMTVLILPLPKDSLRLVDLLVHENFHSIQEKLGHTGSSNPLNHLDTKKGRILLRLEIEALQAAIASHDKTPKHALYFRKLRFEAFPKALVSEIGLETLEGLPTYTGFHFAYKTPTEIENYFVEIIKMRTENPSYIRSSAYATGPMYGYLFDCKKDKWHRNLDSTYNVYALAKSLYHISEEDLSKFEFEKLAPLYEYETILAEENERQKQNEEKLKTYRKMFLEDAYLQINFGNMRITFDPRNMVSLEEYGTVYPNCTVRDYFGELLVNEGTLMAHDWTNMRLSKPDYISTDIIRGKGWEIKLSPKAELIKKEDGTYLIQKRKQ